MERDAQLRSAEKTDDSYPMRQTPALGTRNAKKSLRYACERGQVVG
jgi:hypothetical protein